MTYAIMGRETNMTQKESISVRNVEHIHTSTIKLDLSHTDLAVAFGGRELFHEGESIVCE